MAKVHSGLSYDAISVQDLFGRNDYFQVPRYQRGYSWTNEEVAELLDDLFEVYTKFPSEAYLLGQIIVCPGELKLTDLSTWDLIDGQQRLTTLYLLILTCYQSLTSEFRDSQTKKRQQRFSDIENILYWFDDADDEEIPRARLKTAADGSVFIDALLNGEALPDFDSSPTQNHIREAIETIENFFSTNTETAEEKWAFLFYVLDHAVFIKLQLDDSNHALRVFLKVNNRGLVLDDADLLKSLLFQKVKSDSDFESLSKSWDTATNSLFKSRLKRVRSMEFLMKLLIGIETGTSVSTGKVFDEWSKFLTTEATAKEFGRQLPTRAANLAKISTGKIPTVHEDPQLDFTNLTFGTQLFKSVQHFEVLLAGDHLSPKTYFNVAQIVEERTLLSLLGNEKSQDYERKVHGWAKSVRDLHATAPLEEIRASLSSMLDDVDELFQGLRILIPKMSYSKTSHHKKLRYVLARSSKFVQESVAALDIPLSSYMATSRKLTNEQGYEIDHIFPQSLGQRGFWRTKVKPDQEDNEETEHDLDSWIHSIGNLVLLHPSDNHSQGDTLPWEEQKINNFALSELWINRMLNDDELSLPGSANRDRFNSWKAIASGGLRAWNEDEIEKRTALYCQIIEDSFRSSLGVSKR